MTDDELREKLNGIYDQNEIIGRMIASQGKRTDDLTEKLNALEKKLDDYHAATMAAIKTKGGEE